MFDKKLYVETFSALHASEDTLAELRKLTVQSKTVPVRRIRPALVCTAAAVLVFSSAVLAAGTRRMAGWVHQTSFRNVENMGLHCPEQLGEYRLSGSFLSRVHVVPEDSNGLAAWLDPDYTWFSLNYADGQNRFLSLIFGKTDDPLWAYCFDYDAETGVWLGPEDEKGMQDSSDRAEDEKRMQDSPDRAGDEKEMQDPAGQAGDNKDHSSRTGMQCTEEAEYRGCTIYLADPVTGPEAHWVDPEIGMCFSLSSGSYRITDGKDAAVTGSSRITQEELLGYAESIIDENR